MTDPIPLFKLTPQTWDVTDAWQFYDASGAPHTTDLSERKWLLDCDHDGECDLTDSARCGTPIGYRLVTEFTGS